MSYTNQDAPLSGSGVGNQKYGTQPRTDDNAVPSEYADRFDNTGRNATGGTHGATTRGTNEYGTDSTVTGYNQGASGRGGAGNHGFASSALRSGNDNDAEYGSTTRPFDPTDVNAGHGGAGNRTAGAGLYNTDESRRRDAYGQDATAGTRGTDDPTYVGTGGTRRDVDMAANTVRAGRHDADDENTHGYRRRGSRSRSRSRSKDREDRNKTGKVPVGEKIKGSLEQVKGKVTKDPELVQRGADRKAGELADNQYGRTDATSTSYGRDKDNANANEYGSSQKNQYGDRTDRQFGTTGLSGDNEYGNTRRTDDTNYGTTDRTDNSYGTTGRSTQGEYGNTRRTEDNY